MSRREKNGPSSVLSLGSSETSEDAFEGELLHAVWGCKTSLSRSGEAVTSEVCAAQVSLKPFSASPVVYTPEVTRLRGLVGLSVHGPRKGLRRCCRVVDTSRGLSGSAENMHGDGGEYQVVPMKGLCRRIQSSSSVRSCGEMKFCTHGFSAASIAVARRCAGAKHR